MYYVLTSKKKERIEVTKSYEDAYEFITKNHDAKIRTMDYNAKPKIMDKRVFLKAYYKSTENKNKFFELIDIMVTGRTNIYDLLNLLGLREDYRAYKQNINTIP